MKIMMRNLSRGTTEAELLILFKEYGDVQYCKLVMDKVTGKSKGKILAYLTVFYFFRYEGA
jgi:RNA recognition motif-containing protein